MGKIAGGNIQELASRNCNDVISQLNNTKYNEQAFCDSSLVKKVAVEVYLLANELWTVVDFFCHLQ